MNLEWSGTVPAAVALMLAGAAWCITVAMRRAPSSVHAARAAMYGEREVSAAPSWRSARLAGGVARAAQRRFGAGLQLVDLTAADVATRVIVSGGAFLVGSLALLSGLTAMGALQARFWWPAVAIALAVMGGWTAWRGIAAKVERERRALRQAANDFVQLVAVGLTTDQSVEEAIRFALDVGASDGSDRLRHRVITAPQRGVAVWDAIEEFGREYDLRELCEFAVSVERQGTQGVSIGETVGALAAGMRSRALDELEREADRANANLSGPTVGFVVATVVFLAYPLAQRISEAFGG